MSISLNNISFYYSESPEKIFDGLTLNIDTGWRLGVVGRNGRGKTTFLNIIDKKLIPVSGEIHVNVDTSYFPYTPNITQDTVFNVIKQNIAPYEDWERRMEELLRAGYEKSLTEYGEVLERYQLANGYEIDSLIEKEFSESGMSIDLLTRNFNTLSGGEKTRVLIIALFLKKHTYPLIDEPTNHLDMNGRIRLAGYLSGKKGFMVVSHDRNFLDLCTDHILSVNKGDVRINKGNYSQWKQNMDLEDEFEKRRNKNIRREVRSLEESAKKYRGWSNIKEKEKTGAYDKGYIGHMSAKQMKRALQIEGRIERKLEEKKALLKNSEYEYKLKIDTDNNKNKNLIALTGVNISYGNREIITGFSMEVHKGERVALTGNNGAGKSSLINVIRRELIPDKGIVHIPAYIKISFARQIPEWTTGLLRDHLRDAKMNETRFRNILGVMGAWGEMFDRPLETFSKGELKKVELSKSFIEPADLLIWDEPMNYLDINSREQMEEMLLEFEPTILFTEHDKHFIEKIATREIKL